MSTGCYAVQGPIEAGRLDDERELASLDGRRAAAAQAIVIDPVRSADPERCLAELRQSHDPRLYLKPVVLALPEALEAGGDELVAGVDGVWDRDEHPDSLPRAQQSEIEVLAQRVARYRPTTDRGDTSLEGRVLRFMASRQDVFEPEADHTHPRGYRYGRLEPMVAQDGPGVLETLTRLADRQYLTGAFVARTHACSRCGCAFLNFQETCPDCGSADLDVDDWVHHFRCAYTGPQEDFAHEGQLVCPKCDRLLRQIGVDYDKPAIIYDCHRCGHDFHEPSVTADCYRCGHSAPPEMQRQRSFYRYEVTAHGRNVAAHGMADTIAGVLNQSHRVLEAAPFRVLVEGEAARAQRYGTDPASLVLLHIEGLDQIHLQLGARTSEVISDLLDTFSRVIRDSDYLAIHNESLFLVLLTETDLEGARTAAERLHEGAVDIFEGNLAAPPLVRFDVEPVDADLEVSSAISRMLDDATA